MSRFNDTTTQEFDDQAKKLKEEYDVSIIEYNKNLALNPRPISDVSPPKEKSAKKKKAATSSAKSANSK